ncbi:phenylalanine--tRNA ligase subunit beta [Bryobacter aggregatus]|uniref:phenylalanine--tRNA ligase subunit beta n=1 Tax=Bryobacter aggregatus TaxID=360054 RepID=UPI0004E0D141|nr:phenylalanine--tRNA ligase subunit beta [Bryobacter aggregatus]
MKFSYQWLTELVEDLDIDAKEVSRRITLHTAESEGVEEHGALWKGACPATVLSVESIPNAHNVKAEVETALYGKKTLVCGAPNCRAGLRTIYIPLGVKRISGVDSDGMLASPAELGINGDHDGIIELSEDFALAPDAIIEIDNKSLTHRPDLWGHYGMARELAAILDKPLVDPVSLELLPEGDPQVAVEVLDSHLCPRFSAQLFENVSVTDSPYWLQYRLQSIGLNSISNIVDVTNWLLAELPQPTHAYDADKIHGKIIVRRATDGETMLALNGEEYTLTAEDLVIADEQGAIGIAGVIGGKASSIGPDTKRIILEAANFNASAVRKTSSRLKLRTDASMRFEKAQDPVNTLRAIARGAELFELVSPGIRAVGGPTDVAAVAKPLPVITLSLPWLTRKLGREIAKPEVIGILTRLAFLVEDRGDTLLVTVPSWRATKDVSIPDDLVEEIGRTVGYATITPVAPAMPVVPPPVNEERRYFNRLRNVATQHGYHEIYNYSFISEAQASRLGVPLASHVRVLNPIASDQSLMRTTLLHGVLKNFEDNRKHFDAFRFFEIGKEIHKQPSGLPSEVPHLVAGVYQNEGALQEIQNLVRAIAPQASFEPTTEVHAYEHPQRVAIVFLDGVPIGRIFEFHPNWVEGRAAVLNLNLDTLAPLLAKPVRYAPIRRFPASEFDLSVLTAPRVYANAVESVLRSAASTAVEQIAFVRDFTLPDQKRSLSFRVTVANKERTLTQEEITAERDALIAAIRSAGFELR